jgi:hypothetical protein
MNPNVLKGLLIILVILDHNDFARSVIPGFLRAFSFHVVGFMALPFLRDTMRPFTAQFAQYTFRLYYPFALVTCALSVAAWIAAGTPASAQIQSTVLALYSGNWKVLDQTTGLALLWFLPSLISLLFLRALIESLPRYAGAMLLAMACVAHFFVGKISPAAQAYFPMGLLPAIYVLPLAYVIASIHKGVLARVPTWLAISCTLALFVAVKLVQMRMNLTNEIGFLQVASYTRPWNVLVNDLEAVTGSVMMFQLARALDSKLVATCGQYSMQVYLIHAFVAAAIYKLLGLLPAGSPLLAFPLSLALTVVLSAALVTFLLRFSVVRRFVFPRSTHDLALRSATPAVDGPSK